MSDREWKFYIDDMLRFAEKVLAYSAGLDQALFGRDELKYDAILRNLELIGEAATHVPAAVRQKHPVIPWRQMIAVIADAKARLCAADLGERSVSGCRRGMDVPVGSAAPALS